MPIGSFSKSILTCSTFHSLAKKMTTMTRGKFELFSLIDLGLPQHTNELYCWVIIIALHYITNTFLIHHDLAKKTEGIIRQK
jgi:hypothetical protein